MRYLQLIYLEAGAMPQSEAAFQEMLTEYTAYADWLRATGQYLAGDALQPPSDATTVEVRDGGRIVTDGPFAETKEHLAGYYLIDAPDLDAAIEAATRIPGARVGKVEVRPIMETG